MAWKLIDLFCGAGGMSLGFVDSRFHGAFKPILAIDNDAAAIATHKAYFGGAAYCGDIEEWLAENDVPAADVVIGGPPADASADLVKPTGRAVRSWRFR